MGLVRQNLNDSENSERGRKLNTNGRKAYMTSDAECIKERCVRVAAIIIATTEGSKNNCVQEIIRNHSAFPRSVAPEWTYHIERV